MDKVVGSLRPPRPMPINQWPSRPLAGVALAISLAALLLSEWLVRRPHPREEV